MEEQNQLKKLEASGEKKNGGMQRESVSFSFTKHSNKRLLDNQLLKRRDENSDREMILAIEEKKVKSSIPKEEKKPLVIPPIQKNVWRQSKAEIPGSFKTDISSSESLEELALKELLQESAKENEKWEKRETKNISIPMVIQNKIPEGFETDDNLNVGLRADESTLEEYEKIPIDEFGAAVLRGLGCNPGDPMGNKNKKFIKPLEAVPRSKGLGLGADKKYAKSTVSQQQPKGTDELKFVPGAYVCITHGQYEGMYGQVEGIDESRAVIKLEREKKSVSLPVLYMNVVSKKEFQKESKVINKKSYDKYNKKLEGKSDTERREEILSLEAGIEKNSSRNSNGVSQSHKSRRSETQNKSESCDGNIQKWVCPLLRVRIIDSQYKNGKYYKQKVTVEDVLGPNNCVCKTEDGRYLEDISTSMLETVIPRSEPAHIMMVDGKYRGQLGLILKRDKANCAATVQFLSDRRKVTKLNYDSICEYVGDVSQFD